MSSLKLTNEPELSEVPQADKMIIRNILYSAWALQPTDQSCISWNVLNKTWGYVINVSFSANFSISLSDMQMIKDLNSLRIENVMIRSSDKPNIDETIIGAVLVVKLLNKDQPVTFTESEIIRVRKRHRGWFTCE
jgi:hypothetical protein